MKKTDGVVTVLRAGGQFQVVIGNHVNQVYEDVVKVTGEIVGGGEKVKLNLFDAFIQLLSGIMLPFVAILCAGGMVKGFNALFNFMGLYEQTDGTYMLLNAVGDSVFMFMPVIIGFTAAKKFDVNQMVGIAIGLAMVYPTVQATALSAAYSETGPLGQLFGVQGLDYYFTFLGIPVVANNYTSSLIPVIVVVAFAAQVQKLFKKILPDLISNFFVPFFVLLISVPIGYIIIGPVIGLLSSWLSVGFMYLFGLQPIIFSIVLGGLWMVLVMFGLHMALIPLVMINFGTLGYDNFGLGTFPHSFGLAAVMLALFIKIRDPQMKAGTIPAFISAICGVTEPAIYGFALPRRKPFIIACISAAIGGGTFALVGQIFNPEIVSPITGTVTGSGAAAYTMGGLGVFGFPSYINPYTGDGSGVLAAAIGCVVAMVLGFVATMLFWKEPLEEPSVADATPAVNPVTEDQVVIAPVAGKVIPLAEVADQAFAEGLLGSGVAIEPTEGKLYAPFDGTVTALFPTNHALGLTAKSGLELLIHIGLDTVKLDGKYFTAHIKQGDEVKAGDLLMEFDLAGIQSAGYNTQIPIVVTNTPQYSEIVPTKEVSAQRETELITALV